MNLPIKKPNIILPKNGIDLNKWSVIACDQFTSEPKYWDKLSRYIGGAFSTLYLIYPEAYLSSTNQEEFIERINNTMLEYRQKDIFYSIDDYILTIRTTKNGNVRKGLMALVDLDEYDPFGKLSIRATEKTVRERLPIRVKIRENASIELPHIMVLIDDPDKEVIEEAYNDISERDLLYSFELNSNGGSVKGYRVASSEKIERAIKSVADKHNNNDDLASFFLAVGDGNHSLASAKACWENKKAGLTEEEKETDPERYALVEIVNLYDQGVRFEPINRIIKNADESFLLGLDAKKGSAIEVMCRGKRSQIHLEGTAPEIIATVQTYIDDYLQTHGECSQDYVHNDENTMALSNEGVAIFMPKIEKESFFKYIDEKGVLTRKAFSMGEAEEKRYYLEARIIKE